MITSRSGEARRWAITLVPVICTWCGCAGMNHAERGAAVGTTLGALAGGVIGHQSGNTAAGAILGGGAGMLAGAIVGDAEDAREERDAAIARAQYAEYQAATYSPPLTNMDLVYMAQNGLSDEVILNAVKSRGGRFELEPAALVELKRNGVSDGVISYIQRQGGRPPAARIVPASRSVVVVEPVTTVGFTFGAPPCHYHYRHHHRYPGCYW